ncbi:MAG: DnaA ATPase domain-containing protein [Phycisphaerales bacterium JB038]
MPDSEMCLCARIAEQLATTVGSERYERFFAGNATLALSGDRLDLDVPNRFAADCIKRNFGQTLQEVAQREAGGPVEVCIRVTGAGPEESGRSSSFASATRPPAAFHGDAAQAASRPVSVARPHAGAATGAVEARHHPQSPLGRRLEERARPSRRTHRHVLETFLIGAANQLAYEAALRVGDSGDTDFRMLFVPGTCGVGKTHLLRGIMRRRRQRFPQQTLRYVTGEQFTNEFIAAIKSGKLEAFRAQLSRLDLLCIDDVHFLSNKQATQAELLHTLKMLDLSGGHLVLASDEHPSQIRKFADHLTSRFMSGMVAQIETPEFELRRRLAVDFAARRQLRLSEPVTEALAHRFDRSPRELHGAIMKLEVVQRLCGGVDGGAVNGLGSEVGMASYRRAFAASEAAPSKPVQAGRVLEVVCDQMGVDLSDVLGRGRHRRVVLARSLCAYLIRECTTLSYPEIAERMSRPNHSTVITACQRVKRQLGADEKVTCGPGLPATSLRALVESLRRQVVRG